MKSCAISLQSIQKQSQPKVTSDILPLCFIIRLVFSELITAPSKSASCWHDPWQRPQYSLLTTFKQPNTIAIFSFKIFLHLEEAVLRGLDLHFLAPALPKSDLNSVTWRGALRVSLKRSKWNMSSEWEMWTRTCLSVVKDWIADGSEEPRLAPLP